MYFRMENLSATNIYNEKKYTEEEVNKYGIEEYTYTYNRQCYKFHTYDYVYVVREQAE